MEQKIIRWEFGGFSVAAILGTILHFLYGLTGENVLTAPFSAVNESTWEHMKILFIPLFFFALIQSRYFKETKSFWCVKLLGTLEGLILIPVLFYTYNGTFGKSPDFVNIGIFFASAATVFLLEAQLLKNETFRCKRPWLPFLLLCLIFGLFVLFTFNTPQIPLFKDPISGGYGIIA
ncbi:MAG: hypothetical protein E7660_07515 [Ruminococcaceae bacterium]|nr:hypothetical protein [Oscillospiraceae bacterium]